MEMCAGPWSEQVMDHFMNPRNLGEMEGADSFGIGGDILCGDSMILFLRIRGDVIVDASFLVQGCVAAIASSSVTTELVKGKTLEEAKRILPEDISNALGGLPEHKMHCSVLGAAAIGDAVRRYEEPRGAQ
ncbi:MAG: iron-sulfur cluster assembly scaffold protein [Bacillota bacterium]